MKSDQEVEQYRERLITRRNKRRGRRRMDQVHAMWPWEVVVMWLVLAAIGMLMLGACTAQKVGLC